MYISKYKILFSSSIRDAVKKMDENEDAFCVCVDKKGLVMGVMTDGDFRKAIHGGIQLDQSVTLSLNRDFYYVQEGYNASEVDNIFKNTIVRRIPVLRKGKLVDVIRDEQFYGEKNGTRKSLLTNSVVIMAGGKGTRLDPFTRILPKPLIPIGNDPVIKVIMDEFGKFGMKHFYVSLHDKERMVRAYFYEHKLGYKLEYIYEDKPLGTAGALQSLKGKMKEPFFVSNCDIIIRADYGSFLDFHQRGGYALTLVGSMRQYTIPYGVCKINSSGTLLKIQEKPQFDFLVNTGMYLLEPKVLKFIPKGKFFDMTDLIRLVMEKDLTIGIFPVSEKSWIDVGQLNEYKTIISMLQ